MMMITKRAEIKGEKIISNKLERMIRIKSIEFDDINENESLALKDFGNKTVIVSGRYESGRERYITLHNHGTGRAVKVKENSIISQQEWNLLEKLLQDGIENYNNYITHINILQSEWSGDIEMCMEIK